MQHTEMVCSSTIKNIKSESQKQNEKKEKFLFELLFNKKKQLIISNLFFFFRKAKMFLMLLKISHHFFTYYRSDVNLFFFVNVSFNPPLYSSCGIKELSLKV